MKHNQITKIACIADLILFSVIFYCAYHLLMQGVRMIGGSILYAQLLYWSITIIFAVKHGIAYFALWNSLDVDTSTTPKSSKFMKKLKKGLKKKGIKASRESLEMPQFMIPYTTDTKYPLRDGKEIGNWQDAYERGYKACWNEQVLKIKE